MSGCCPFFSNEALRKSDGPDFKYPKASDLVAIGKLPREIPDHLFYSSVPDKPVGSTQEVPEEKALEKKW